eukprot:6920685-Heterocapsa_arctica.AAC.1
MEVGVSGLDAGLVKKKTKETHQLLMLEESQQLKKNRPKVDQVITILVGLKGLDAEALVNKLEVGVKVLFSWAPS